MIRHLRGTLARAGIHRLQLALTAVALVVGFIFAVQSRTEQSIETGLQVSSGRLGEVAYRYRAEDDRQAAMRAEITDLRRAIASEEQRAAAEQRVAATLADELRTLRADAGLTALRGPGVAVTISDSRRPLRPGEDPNLVLIHYSDVRAVVNMLWAAGAEAIAVNDERIITTTGISCVGTTILCNTRRMAPPYRIVAIGDPEGLTAAVQSRTGILAQLRIFEFPVTVILGTDLVVPAYNGGFVHRYATPAGTGG
ncbi:MAG TPA: DUF881 domain-containing protein [bacterium]|nr:DUF881 domain-containing protein [bacterium]